MRCGRHISPSVRERGSRWGTLSPSIGRCRDTTTTTRPAFEAARRPIVEKLVRSANASAEWYEQFAEHMRLAPIDFVISYMTRSGRVNRERLRAISLRFLAQYEAAQSRACEHEGAGCADRRPSRRRRSGRAKNQVFAPCRSCRASLTFICIDLFA
jgi:hypothetical protein